MCILQAANNTDSRYKPRKDNPMEIRKIKPEENVHYELMCSICFSRSTAPEDRTAWLEKPEEHTEGYEHVWGAFDNGRLISAMAVVPAQIMINGMPTKAGLICGVVTLPEARNARCVRKIFEIIMPQMKDEGVVYSLLYPFSFDFYRKFGYEHAYVRQRATFPVSELSRYPYPSGVKVHEKDGPWADFATVYNAFSRDKNTAMVRGQKEWKRILKRDPHKNKEFTYIHYNNAGVPDGYILYKIESKEKGVALMNILELAWSDKAGLEAMLGFIHGLRSEVKDISMSITRGLDVHGIVESPWNVTMANDTIIMNRVMDVTEALGRLDAPSGEGNVVIGVTDRFIPSNTDAYSVLWKDGVLKVEACKAAPDMEVDVETLVQLTTGYLTTSQAYYRQDVKLHNKTEELAALFPQKNQYLMEHF